MKELSTTRVVFEDKTIVDLTTVSLTAANSTKITLETKVLSIKEEQSYFYFHFNKLDKIDGVLWTDSAVEPRDWYG